MRRPGGPRRAATRQEVAAVAALGGGPGGSYEPAGAVAAHEALGDPHTQYTTDAEAAALASSAAASSMSSHLGAADPHGQYTTDAEASAIASTAATTAAAAAVTGHEALPNPHSVYQLASARGVADGYASLGSDGKVPSGQLPALSGAWTEVIKTTDESRLSNTTFASDDTLVLALLANTRYRIRGAVRFNTPGAADIKFQFVGPAGFARLTIQRYGIAGGATAFSGIGNDKAYSVSVSLLGTGTDGAYWFDALVENGANAGTFALQWAQVTLTASNTTVQRGSTLEWRTF